MKFTFFEIHPQGFGPISCSSTTWARTKKCRMTGFRHFFHTKWSGHVHSFSEHRFCLHAWTCLDLVAQERHPQPSVFSLGSDPSCLQRNGLTDMYRLFFYNVEKTGRSFPFFCPRSDFCWKARLPGTSCMAVHFEILVVATLLLAIVIHFTMFRPNRAKSSNSIFEIAI